MLWPLWPMIIPIDWNNGQTFTFERTSWNLQIYCEFLLQNFPFDRMKQQIIYCLNWMNWYQNKLWKIWRIARIAWEKIQIIPKIQNQKQKSNWNALYVLYDLYDATHVAHVTLIPLIALIRILLQFGQMRQVVKLVITCEMSDHTELTMGVVKMKKWANGVISIALFVLFIFAFESSSRFLSFSVSLFCLCQNNFFLVQKMGKKLFRFLGYIRIW